MSYVTIDAVVGLDAPWTQVLGCLLMDILAVAVVEMGTHSLAQQRIVSPEEQQTWQWVMEVVLLSGIGCVLFLIHHVPILLILAVLIILLRFMAAYRTSRPSSTSTLPVAASSRRRAPSMRHLTSESDDDIDFYTSPSYQPSGTAASCKKSNGSSHFGNVSLLQRRPLSARPAVIPQSQFSSRGTSETVHEAPAGTGITQLGSGYDGHLSKLRKSFDWAMGHWKPACEVLSSSSLYSTSSLGPTHQRETSTLHLPPQQQQHLITSSSSYPPGLLNSGQNLCFLNSAVQCLARCPGFADSLAAAASAADGGSTAVDCVLQRQLLAESLSLLRQCRKPAEKSCAPRVIDTIAFRRLASGLPGSVVASPAASLYGQRQSDTSEFLLWLFGLWHTTGMRCPQSSPGLKNLAEQEVELICQTVGSANNDTENLLRQLPTLTATSLNQIAAKCNQLLSVPTGNDTITHSLASVVVECERLLFSISPVSHCVSFQVVAERRCQQCRCLLVRSEPCSILSLPLPPASQSGESIPLATCLEHFSRVEQVERFQFEHCQCGDVALCRQVIRRPPPVLCIQLLRFAYDQTRNSTQKVLLPVSFPLTGLSLRCIEFDDGGAGAGVDDGHALYDLCAVCTHIGQTNASFGHYIAYAKEQPSGEWYKLDDNAVYPVNDMSSVINSRLLLTSAYLLFYARR
eukprot:scpid31962/ scgid32433/ Ubiquitin carboxyl-terminal hydrolase 2; 41 kDa ubiquitin-specific protease; Deubiquitinating enzyme 2; Ubiquitin thioesterase 2; Ubiquitin-specific-processing protease 2